MEKKLRRIITGHNEEGKSVVAYDGSPYGDVLMWATDSSPADNKHSNDAAKLGIKLEPPVNGSKFGYFMVNPEDPSKSAEDVEKEYAAGFAAMEASHCRPDTSNHPGMHTTKLPSPVIPIFFAYVPKYFHSSIYFHDSHKKSSLTIVTNFFCLLKVRSVTEK
ncbi:unnamed protein product [marine sediment metagenome]|uniref:Uncharacterized protein n=1 Tax=marine sediment metagenome TaxID=412755 RepID=X0ZB84_9ZZZZ